MKSWVTTMGEYFGIDISSFNQVTNYDLIAKEQDFVFIRAGGADNKTPYGFYKDRKFEEYYTQLSKRFVPLGAYYLAAKKFLTVEDGRIQAQNFIGLIRGKKFTMPIVLDMEVPQAGNQKEVTDASVSFLETLESHGYYAMIYASDISGFIDRVELSRLARFDKWVARYGTAPKNAVPYGIWQSSSKGIVPGINGNVDLDRTFNDYPDIITKARLNHLEGR